MADKKIEKKGGGEGSGNNPLVLVIVWGGLLLLLFGGLKGSGFLDKVYITNSSSIKNCQANNPACNVIGVAYKGEALKNSIFHYSKNVDVYQIINSSVNSNLFYAATNHGVFFSQDQGKSWYPFSDLNKKIDQNTIIHKIIENPNSPQEIFISVYKNGIGNIYKSNDGLFTLTSLMEFNRDMARDMTIFRRNLYLGLGSGKILSYSLDTKKIKQIIKFSSAIYSFSNVSDNIIYVMISASRVYKSTDGNNFLQDNSLSNAKDIIVSQDGLAIYVTTKNGLSRSVDFGNNFTSIQSLPLDSNKIEKVAASSINHVYVFGDHQIYESLDGGATWKSYNSNISRIISTVNITNDKILVGTKAFSSFNLWQNLFQI